MMPRLQYGIRGSQMLRVQMTWLPCLDWRTRRLLQHHDGTYRLRFSLEWFSVQLYGSSKAALHFICFQGIDVNLAGALRKKKEAYNELHGALLLQCFPLSKSLLVTFAGRGSSHVLNCSIPQDLRPPMLELLDDGEAVQTNDTTSTMMTTESGQVSKPFCPWFFGYVDSITDSRPGLARCRCCSIQEVSGIEV